MCYQVLDKMAAPAVTLAFADKSTERVVSTQWQALMQDLR